MYWYLGGGGDGGVAVLGDGWDMEEGEEGICGDWRDTVDVGSLSAMRYH